ncbi:MAG: methyltransferase domain-containing protein [Anaerolineales bacterium]|nr:methyltransferase domain-containing protein [Anaerolineales bacterium]
MAPSQSECEFCLKLRPGPALARAWYDFHILWELPDFVLVPALGSLVPGYLMLVTKRHVPSMAHLSVLERQALQQAVRQVAARQAEHWAPPVIFEHGACDDEARAGSCITHAHWHLVPSRWPLRQADRHWEPIESFESLAAVRPLSTSYFFVADDTGLYWSLATRAPSQYFRRSLAQVLGQAEAWDYAVFPFYDHMRETLAKLAPPPPVSPTIQAYNAMAPAYYARTCAYSPESGLPAVVTEFIHSLRGRRVLDAGAGACRDSRYLISQGLTVEAVDLAERLLQLSAGQSPVPGRRVMDVRRLAYADEVFDGIWCSAVLLHLAPEELARALAEFQRVLKPGGSLHLSLKEGQGSQRLEVQSDTRVYREFYYYRQPQITHLLEQAGFSPRACQQVQEADSDSETVTWLRCLVAKVSRARPAAG